MSPSPTPPSKKVLGIRQRLLLWLVPPLVLLWALSVVSDYRLAQDPAQEAFDRSLLDSALALAGNLKKEGPTSRLELSAEAEAVLRFDGTDHVYFAVFDGQHRIAGDPELSWRAPAETGTGFFSADIAGQPIRGVLYRVDAGRQPVTIQVAETLHKRERLIRRLLAALVWPNLLLIIAAAALIGVGVRVALTPLLRLRNDVASRSPRDLKPLTSSDVPGELQPLVDSLNRLFGLIAEQAEAQQRFIANAAHQLKTPLAALQTQLELAAMDQDHASVRLRLAQLELLTERVAHLAHQLLALARSEPGASLGAQTRHVDLRAVAEQIASSHLDFSLRRNIDLGFELGEASLQGVPWLLQELLSNLVDNALRYTPPGGTVTVRCGTSGRSAYLEVEDNGPGIPATEREKIFARFYRSADSVGDGCGLGLAIVREIADLHGARILVEPGAAGRGSRFRVSFPAEPA